MTSLLFFFFVSACHLHVRVVYEVVVVFAEDVVNVIVEGGAIPALVKHLQAPPLSDLVQHPLPFEHEVEKGSAFALGLLAVKVA